MTVQVHEIYASLWSNQKIILQFIDVLTCVKASSLKNINVEWGKENIAFIDRFGQIMKRILTELKDLLQRQQQHKALKDKADKILAIANSFDAVLEYLQKHDFAQTKVLIINWKRFAQIYAIQKWMAHLLRECTTDLRHLITSKT